MGAKASKPAQAATRRFPTKAPSTPLSPSSGISKTKANSKASRDPEPVADLNASSSNQGYSERLRKMGIANPQPTYSPSSTAGYTPAPSAATPNVPSPAPSPSQYPPSSHNRTLSALEARRALQAQAEAEFHDPAGGRAFLDAATVRRALLLRGRGVPDREVEATLRLKKGVVARLGPLGVAVPVEAAEMNRQTWGGLHE